MARIARIIHHFYVPTDTKFCSHYPTARPYGVFGLTDTETDGRLHVQPSQQYITIDVQTVWAY